MGRQSAKEMRELVRQAQSGTDGPEGTRASELRKIANAATEDAARRTSFWRAMYSAALNGSLSATLENLTAGDVQYFERLGFALKGIFIRSKTSAWCKSRIAELEEKIEKISDELWDIEVELDQRQADFGVINCYEKIEYWLSESQATAYACDMEEWFNYDFDEVTISSLEELQALQSHTQEHLNQSKDPERIKSLRKLLRAIGEPKDQVAPPYDFKGAESRIEALGKEIDALQSEVAAVEESEDHQRDDSLRNVYRLFWIEANDEGDDTEGEGFSYSSLQWMCSVAGQEFLKSLDAEFVSLAREGCQSIELECSTCEDGILISHEDSGFKGHFPSWFDFREALTLLGYKVAEVKSKGDGRRVLVRW